MEQIICDQIKRNCEFLASAMFSNACPEIIKEKGIKIIPGFHTRDIPSLVIAQDKLMIQLLDCKNNK